MQLPFIDPLLLANVQHKAPLTLVCLELEIHIIRVFMQNVIQDAPVGTRAISIRGEMGIGKSRLLAEIYKEI